jgi:hypothetical protein
MSQISRPAHKHITVRINHYCASAGNNLGNFYLINASYVIAKGQLLLDSDRDGVPEALDTDATLGLTPNSAFSISNGFGDLVAFATGMNSISQIKLMTYQACTNPRLDTDEDGLSDCAEKSVLKTKQDEFDTDGDGIPDELELRFGLNAIDASDDILNSSGDGFSNLQKIKMQLPIRESTTETLKQEAHEYELIPSASTTSSQLCFDLKVTNIPIIPTANGNLAILHLIEKTLTSTSVGNPSSASSRLNRCCSVIPSDFPDLGEITLTWGESSELNCPCPLLLDPNGGGI